MTDIPSTGELGAALLWLRNFYDASSRPLNKKQILKIIDEILNEPGTPNTWVTFADMKRFREKYQIWEKK